MQFKNILFPLALGATASAQSLTEALAANNATLSVLTGLITGSPGLAETLSSLSNITILAPNNEALNTFLNSTAGKAAAQDPSQVAALLTYHVLNGSYPGSAFTNMTAFAPTALNNQSYANVTGGQVVGAKLNDSSVVIYSGLLQASMVVQADLNFTGGVIHIIDTVLTIPASVSDTAAAANLTSVAGALTRANLVNTVNELEDVTIFAPSNAAFSAIGSATGNLTTEALSGILTYHVVQGTVGYSSMLSNTTLETVGGGNVTISIIDGSVFVNSAKVIVPDVLVANGVVHVIDGVLNPANATATPNPTTTAAAFPGATTASGGSVPFTSDVPVASTTITNAPSGSGEPGAAAPTSTGAAGRALPTGAAGMGALLGGALLFAANL